MDSSSLHGVFLGTAMNPLGSSLYSKMFLFLLITSVVIKALTQRRINDMSEWSGKPAHSLMYEVHLNEDDTENKSTEGNKRILISGNNSTIG